MLGVFIHFLFCGFNRTFDSCVNGNMYSIYVMWCRVTYYTWVVFVFVHYFCWLNPLNGGEGISTHVARASDTWNSEVDIYLLSD